MPTDPTPGAGTRVIPGIDLAAQFRLLADDAAKHRSRHFLTGYLDPDFSGDATDPCRAAWMRAAERSIELAALVKLPPLPPPPAENDFDAQQRDWLALEQWALDAAGRSRDVPAATVQSDEEFRDRLEKLRAACRSLPVWVPGPPRRPEAKPGAHRRSVKGGRPQKAEILLLWEEAQRLYAEIGDWAKATRQLNENHGTGYSKSTVSGWGRYLKQQSRKRPRIADSLFRGCSCRE